MNFERECDLLFHKASQDLEMARIAIDSNKIDIELIMFHLQQSAEKFIKSILSFHKIEFPKIHDIDRLIALLESNKIEPLPDYINLFIDLSDFAVEGRYAIIQDNIDDAGSYVELLSRFMGFLKGKIKPTISS